MHSQPECPSRLICRDRRRTARFEVGQPLESDPTVFQVDHCFVLLDELGWHNRSGALLIAATAGVQVAYGSDLLGATHMHQSEELRIRAQAAGNAEAIRSATTIAARLLQHEGKLGVLAAGAWADVLVVDGNPLDDISLLLEQGAHLPVIIKDGQLIKHLLAGSV